MIEMAAVEATDLTVGAPQAKYKPSVGHLIILVATGDRSALKTIYEWQGPKIFAFLLTQTSTVSVAEDTLVDVFVEIWRQAASFDRLEIAPETWLFSLVRERAVARIGPLHLKLA